MKFQQNHTLESMAANFWSKKCVLLVFFLRKATAFLTTEFPMFFFDSAWFKTADNLEKTQINRKIQKLNTP